VVVVRARVVVTWQTTGSLKLGEETYLAYLPAAHILELVAEHAMVC
jgi:long-subunit acyl-CoA synthetase (AMP-forming)